MAETPKQKFIRLAREGDALPRPTRAEWEASVSHYRRFPLPRLQAIGANLGWEDSHIEYLTHMAHDVYGPTDFDQEVQKHLDALQAEENNEKTEDPRFE
jgi:hypothetical protein